MTRAWYKSTTDREDAADEQRQKRRPARSRKTRTARQRSGGQALGLAIRMWLDKIRGTTSSEHGTCHHGGAQWLAASVLPEP